MAEAVNPQAGATARIRRATGTDTVVVACNLPMGHILQLFSIEKVSTVLPNGERIEENATTRQAQQFALRGPINAGALAMTGRNIRLPRDYRMVDGKAPDCGYAFTFGIPRDFWEQWAKDNRQSPLLLDKHIFAAKNEDEARGLAEDYYEIRSGLQGLNQSGDYRVPNGKTLRKFDEHDNERVPENAQAE